MLSELRRRFRRASKDNPYEGVVTKLYEWIGPPFIRKHHEELADALARELPLTARVLDVGSGPGDLLVLLSKARPDLELVGVDPAGAAVRRASQRVGMNVRVLQAGADKIPYESDYFDVAVATGSYKHWPDRPRGLEEIHRVLKPGGRFLNFELDPDAKSSQLGPVPRPLRPLWQVGMSAFVTVSSVLHDRAREEAEQSPFVIVNDRINPDLPFWEMELLKE